MYKRKFKYILTIFTLLTATACSSYYDDYYAYNAGYYANFYPRGTLFEAHTPNGFGPDGLYVYPFSEFRDFTDNFANRIRYLDATWGYDLMSAIITAPLRRY